MHVLHSVLKRGGLVWDRAALPAALFEERLARARAAIAAAGLDAWLVYGDALRYGNLAYLSHFLPRVRSALLLVPREGAPSLLVAWGARDIPAAKTLTWIDDVRPFTRLPGELKKLIVDRGLERARVGLVGVLEEMSVSDWEAIEGLLPDVQWQPVEAPLDAARLMKDARELAVMERAAEMVHAGLRTAAEVLRAGVSERQALAAVDRQLRWSGAEDVRLLVASGPRASSALRPVDDRVLEVGDVVLLYAAAEHQRYWAEAGHTYVLGPANAATRALADTAQQTVGAMTRAARAGAAAGTVAEAALGVLGGATAARESALQYGLGHGIGLDAEEPPAIRHGETATLPAGTTLALRAVLHDTSGRGALAGRTVVVGGDGARVLGPDDLPALTEC